MCLMVYSADPRLHYKPILNFSPLVVMVNAGFVITKFLKHCHMMLPHFLMSWIL